MPRHAMLAQVGRAGDHHAADAAERLRDQRRILQRADADADVDAFLEQVHHAVVQQHAAAHLVVALQEARDRGRHVHVAEQHRRGDGEVPGGFGRVGASARGPPRRPRPAPRARSAGSCGLPRSARCAAWCGGTAARPDGPRARPASAPPPAASCRARRAARGQAALVGDLHEGLHGFEAVHRAIKPENGAVKCDAEPLLHGRASKQESSASTSLQQENPS